MKITISKAFLFFAAINCCLDTQSQAADFSHAKQTIVPPSYIRRDLDALGTNNWSFPGLNSNSFSPSANSDLGLGAITNGASNIDNLGNVSKIQSRVSALINSGQLAEAENVARSGLKAFPNSSILKNQFAKVTASEAQAYLQGQNYDSAGKKARESLVADPNNRVSKSVVGQVLRSQGLDPNSAEGHVSAGDTLANEGRLLEASVEYKLALEIKPNAAAHVGLGNIAIGKGQVTEAHRHFERAVAIDPNSSLAYRQRGALRYVLKDVVGANSDFSKSVSLNANDPVAAEALIGLWKQQVASSPNSANSHLGLARAYMQTNNLEAARGEYKTVVALDPNNPTLPAARASFKLALAKQEADQCVQGARTLDQQGAWNEAHQKLIEAIGYCPNDSQILLYNGQLCERLGLIPEAHDSYMAVLKTDPRNLEAAGRLKMITGAPQTVGSPQMTSSPPPFAPPRPSNTQVGATAAPAGVLNPLNPVLSAPEIGTPAPNTNASAPNFMPSPSLPPAPMINTGPLPEENLQNAPLKSPLPSKTQSALPVPFGNAYYDATENVYIGDSAQVTMLGNFGSCVRALMMAQKQLLQNAPISSYNNTYQGSENLSTAHSQNGWF